MSSTPPIVHVGKRKAPAAGSATTPAAANLLGGAEFSPSRNQAVAVATKTDDGTLQGKSLVQKIHTILAEPNYSSIVSWNDAGTAFIIHDVDAFVSTIMPAHFQQSKFDSFTRRMRRWGFRVVKQPSSSIESSEPAQSTAMEFSSEHFLRDQPELSLLMKDERIVTKQFTFLDRNIRKNDGVLEESNPTGVVHYPPSRGGSMIPSSEIKQPIPIHYPPSSANMNSAQKPEYQQSEVPSTMLTNNMASGLNMEIYGYPHNYSQEQFATNLHPFHPAMPMISPPRPYGYGPPAPQGFGFGPASYTGSPSSLQQQQQEQQQQRIMSIMDAKAHTSSQDVAVMTSSSGESSEVELLPTPKAKRNSQIDDEQKEA